MRQGIEEAARNSYWIPVVIAAILAWTQRIIAVRWAFYVGWAKNPLVARGLLISLLLPIVAGCGLVIYAYIRDRSAPMDGSDLIALTIVGYLALSFPSPWSSPNDPTALATLPASLILVMSADGLRSQIGESWRTPASMDSLRGAARALLTAYAPEIRRSSDRDVADHVSSAKNAMKRIKARRTPDPEDVAALKAAMTELMCLLHVPRDSRWAP